MIIKVQPAVQIVPKYVGLELELGNHLATRNPLLHGGRQEESHDSSLIAATALVKAHHELFGSHRDTPASFLNEFDSSGHRVYVDHLHAEWSLSLVRSATSVVLAFRRAKEMIVECIRKAEESVGPLYVSLNNTNRMGVSWGAHVNVAVSAEAFVRWMDDECAALMPQYIPFCASSPIIFGAGKVGGDQDPPDASFHLSARADRIDRVSAWETVDHKSMINLRDESHADPDRYGRFHIIMFDTSQCEFALWLKVGVLQVICAVLEENNDTLPTLALKDPLDSLHAVSRDLTFKKPLELEDGRKLTALQIQTELATGVQDALLAGSSAENVPDARLIVQRWRETLEMLEKMDPRLGRRIDWIGKLRFLTRLMKRGDHDLAALRLADLDYAKLDGGVFEEIEAAGGVDRLGSPDFVAAPNYCTPKLAPREYARALLITRFGSRLVSIDWSEAYLEDDDGKIYRVAMEDPCDASELIDQLQLSSTWPDCLKRLKAEKLARECVSEREFVMGETPIIELKGEGR